MSNFEVVDLKCKSCGANVKFVKDDAVLHEFDVPCHIIIKNSEVLLEFNQ